jgi:hypothetical protein
MWSCPASAWREGKTQMIFLSYALGIAIFAALVGVVIRLFED